MALDRSHPLRVLNGLMLADNLGDVHDEINQLHQHFGLPEPEGDFLDGFDDQAFSALEARIAAEATPKRLFSVRIAYGTWIVRAADAEQAEQLARVGTGAGDQAGAVEYGVEDEPATVVELIVDGQPQVLDHDYR